LKALGVKVLPLDVTSDDSVKALAKELAGTPIDVLINNAGVGGGSNIGISKVDFELMKPAFDINALGPLRVTQALLPNLRAGERRTIVSITSRMGSIADNSEGDWYAYRASKAALNMFSKNLALELAPEGFICVVMHPGWVRTRMGTDKAPLSVEESVSHMMRVIGNLSVGDTGQFLNYTGDLLPW
jgi:NAD(P)-dependent dehydrogenase (short-subunit alcohol dehydrogenase family)